MTERRPLTLRVCRLACTWVLTLIALAGPRGGIDTAAWADASGGGGIGTGPGGGTLTVGLTVRIGGSPGVPASSASAPRPYRIVSVPAHDPTSPLAGLCPNANGFDGFGWIFTVTVYDTATGAIVSNTTQCIALPGPLGTGVPAGPPQPPTIGEVWQRAPIALPTLGISPPDEGVTGLDTWMWSTSPDTVAINATIDGWSVVGVAVRTDFVFDTGDTTVTRIAEGGDGAHPALVRRYDTKGVRTVMVGTEWRATVTMSGPGVPARTTDIGTATLTVSAAYPVVEVRSTLTS